MLKSVQTVVPPPALAATNATGYGWRHAMARPVALTCGLVLLTAAALKLYGLRVSPFAQYGWLLTPLVQSLALVWEVLLGVWLLTGSSRFLSWLAAIATFLVFGCVSGYLGIIGQAKCGCFGTIEATPWHAFSVDALALAALVVFRPGASESDATHNKRPVLAGRAAGVAIGAAVLVGVAGVFAILFCGGMDAALARLRGERISATPTVVDVGPVAPFELREQSILLVNRTDQPIRIVGANLGCMCALTSQLPIALAPNGQTNVGLRIRGPKDPGNFARQVLFLTDDELQPYVVIQYYGRVTKP